MQSIIPNHTRMRITRTKVRLQCFLLIKIVSHLFIVLIKLKNYVFELNGFTSVPHDFGSQKIFLLLNDSSHDPHFSACQNIETLDGIQKFSNFSLHRFSRYLTPNMALQNIILTSFFLFFFLFFPIEGYAFSET